MNDSKTAAAAAAAAARVNHESLSLSKSPSDKDFSDRSGQEGAGYTQRSLHTT